MGVVGCKVVGKDGCEGCGEEDDSCGVMEWSDGGGGTLHASAAAIRLPLCAC